MNVTKVFKSSGFLEFGIFFHWDLSWNFILFYFFEIYNMGCGSGGCGTSTKGGTPGGCQSHGSCSTGGCNRMNVHDWLANLPFADPESDCRVVEVSFNQGSRKDFYRNATLQYFGKGELIAVEGTNGFDVGEVSLTGELVRLQLKKTWCSRNQCGYKTHHAGGQ